MAAGAGNPTLSASAKFTPWLEALGLDVTVKDDGSGEELWITSGDVEPRLVIRQSDVGTWDVVYERRLAASELSAQWDAPWETELSTAIVGRAVREIACGFPLVASETRDDGGDVVVRFRAPLYDEGLTRQAFVLTVSPVLKATEAFDLALARRAEERKNEQQELIERMTEATATPGVTDPVAPVPSTPASADTVPAAAWSPTHVVKRNAKAWAEPDPAGASAGTLKRRVEVQVTERLGDWAHVVTSNGWSGWIDSRDLKAR
jgi:hypothetical protein